MAIDPSEEWPAETGIPDLLSSTEVEQIFARSARTLHRWERRGHLTPVRVGQAKFYRAEDIRRLVSDQLEGAMATHAGARTGTGQATLTGKSGDQKMPLSHHGDQKIILTDIAAMAIKPVVRSGGMPHVCAPCAPARGLLRSP